MKPVETYSRGEKSPFMSLGDQSRYFSSMEFPSEAAPAFLAYNYTLRLESNTGGVGSGVLISDGCLLTCSHIVAELTENNRLLTNLKVKRTLSDSELVDASIAHNDSKLDFAILNCPGLNLKHEPPIISDPSLYIGDRCYLIGNPSYATLGRPDPGQNLGQVMSIGRLEDYDGSLLYVSAPTINPGYSGGAIVSRDGSLLGIISEQFGFGGRGPSMLAILSAILERKSE